jgi:uncharacterized protein involved in exopolysaccharide biosynthesis
MDLIDFRSLQERLRAKWAYYVIGLAISFVLAGLILPVLDKGYVAQATLQLRESEAQTQFGGLLSSLTSSSDAYNSLEAVLTSRSLAEKLASRSDIVKALNIDPEHRSWPSKVREFIETGVFQMDPLGKENVSDIIRGLLVQKVKLSRSANGSNVVELEFSFRKEGVSQPVLSSIISDADLILRGLRISNLQERLKRINDMVDQTAVESTRKSLLDMHGRLSTELVSAESLYPFAFNVIDPAATTNVRARPSFWLIWIGVTAVLFAAITAVLVLSIKGRE